MYYLYRHIRSDINTPFYIGISKVRLKGLKYSRAYNKSSRSEDWKRVVKTTDYRIEIIYKCDTLNEIYEKEVEFIKLYQKFNLVNKTKGGGGILGHKHKEEIKIKLSILNSGSKHPQYNTKASYETRLKQSKSKLGVNNVLSKCCKCLNTGEVFKSIGEAAYFKYGDRDKHKKISDIIKGRRKSHLGLKFELI